MIDTLDELKNYCKEKNSYGALLLTGEWGCGKTFFINNVFCVDPEISSHYIPIIISLFGESSIENIHNQIKLAYLKEKYLWTNFKPSKIKKLLTNLGKAMNTIDVIKKVIEPLSKLDLLDLYELDGSCNNFKKIVLIFDDLERTELNLNNIIGIINNYCVNKKIKTIVIANEACIKNQIENSYLEYKEKVFSRIIYYTVSSDQLLKIIESYVETEFGYKQFLMGIVTGAERILKIYPNLRYFETTILKFEILYKHFNNLKANRIETLFLNFYLINILVFKNYSDKNIITAIESSYNVNNLLTKKTINSLIYFAKFGLSNDGTWESDLLEEPLPKLITHTETSICDEKEKLCFQPFYYYQEKNLIADFKAASLKEYNFVFTSYYNLLELQSFLINYSYARYLDSNVKELNFELLRIKIYLRIDKLIEFWSNFEGYYKISGEQIYVENKLFEDSVLLGVNEKNSIYFNETFSSSNVKKVLQSVDVYDDGIEFDESILKETKELIYQIQDLKSDIIRYLLVNKFRYESSEGNGLECLYCFSANMEEKLIKDFASCSFANDGNRRLSIIHKFNEIWVIKKVKVIDYEESLNNFQILKEDIEKIISIEVNENDIIQVAICKKFKKIIETVIENLTRPDELPSEITIKSKYFIDYLKN